MRKLKLKAIELYADEILSREQLKNVLGGSGSGCQASECTKDSECPRPTENAGWTKCYITTCLATGAAANFCGLP